MLDGLLAHPATAAGTYPYQPHLHHRGHAPREVLPWLGCAPRRSFQASHGESRQKYPLGASKERKKSGRNHLSPAHGLAPRGRVPTAVTTVACVIHSTLLRVELGAPVGSFPRCENSFCRKYPLASDEEHGKPGISYSSPVHGSAPKSKVLNTVRCRARG